jgi:hypothetical protein
LDLGEKPIDPCLLNILPQYLVLGDIYYRRASNNATLYPRRTGAAQRKLGALEDMNEAVLNERDLSQTG